MKAYYISKYINGNAIAYDPETEQVGVYSHEGDFINDGSYQDFQQARETNRSSAKSMGKNMHEAVINHLAALIQLFGDDMEIDPEMIDQIHNLTTQGLKNNAHAIAQIVSQFSSRVEWMKFTDAFREKYGYNPENRWDNSKTLGYEGLAVINRAFKF